MPSVNTKDPDSSPAAINDCVRRLLGKFSKATYLGITATPFANIFIDPGKMMTFSLRILSTLCQHRQTTLEPTEYLVMAEISLECCSLSIPWI